MTEKQENATQPLIAINAQYVKDISFESPNAPLSLTPKTTAPKIDVSLNLEVKEIQPDNYEVTLEIIVKANHEDSTIFVLELAYSGLFTVKNFSEEQKEMILLIHCPTIIFPFARRIVADVTRDGGFQPLMIDPVDFSALYQQKKQQENNKSNQAVN